MVKSNYPYVAVVENKMNLGAAEARNIGILKSAGEWVLVLDCDTILEDDFIEKAMAVIEEGQADLGTIQPMILNAGGERIYSCGIRFDWLCRFYDMYSAKKPSNCGYGIREVFGACSAAAIYRRSMLEEIKQDTGYFDRRFFFLFEDADLSFRAKTKGYRALLVPEVSCRHAGNSSLTVREARQYMCWRNRKMFFSKHRINLFRKALSLIFYDSWHEPYLFISNRLVRASFFMKDIPLPRELGFIEKGSK